MMTAAPASMTPLFGRTQYLRGAVVFTLKHTFLSEGFFNFRLVVTTSVKGPVTCKTPHPTPKKALVFLYFGAHSQLMTTPQNKKEHQHFS